MAFEASDKRKICRIVGVNAVELDAQLVYWGTHIDSGVEQDVLAEIERWEGGIGTKFVSVSPNPKNFGAKIDPEEKKRDVRDNIRVMLGFPLDGDGGGSSGDSFTIARG
ncbi:hypothetical protein BH10ACI2_BH10ACI2_04290 [soil metagenome]